MSNDIWDKVGLYIAYPTSSTLKSVFKEKSYKGMVNEKHTKIGKTTRNFGDRKKQYLHSFDNEVVFKPIAIISVKNISKVDSIILAEIKKEFNVVPNTRKWFDTSNHLKIIEIILTSLEKSGYKFEVVKL